MNARVHKSPARAFISSASAPGLKPYAEQVAAAVENLERHVSDAARDRSGVIRVACPEPIVRRMTALMPPIPACASNS